MLTRGLADQFLFCLDGLEAGSLNLVTPDGRQRVFSGRQPGPSAQLRLHDWGAITALAARGETGFSESYRSGKWETDNLPNLLSLALQNENVMSRYLFGSSLSQLMYRMSYLLRLNSVKGSRRNIHAHYDLGNAFYRLWLDPSMTYSSAMFDNTDGDLTNAQFRKYDRILDHLVQNSGSVLEIGCGWGGFAARALDRGDYAIKGITLSTEQHEWARSHLGNRANIALEDYRHQTGKFDHIVSIEMFEAVGEQYWNTYFKKIKELLAHHGRAVIQTITIENHRFARYRRGGDMIRNYIFPGGMLPCPDVFRTEAARAGLQQTDTFFFGQDYARTLECWLHNFEGQEFAIRQLGFDSSFIRLWRFYLSSCIAGFRTGRINVMQTDLEHA